MFKWFIEPYKTVASEWQLLSQLKKETSTNLEKRRIRELQSFNIMLVAVYTLFFYIFLGDLMFLIFGNWLSIGGVIFGLLMMKLIKNIQVTRYLKRRDAYIKNDSKLIKK